MVYTPEKMREQLGISAAGAEIEEELSSWDSAAKAGLYQDNFRVQKGKPLFPRIDVEAELAAIEKLDLS